MISKFFILALVAASLSCGSPLETRATLSVSALTKRILDSATAYQSIGDHTVFVGPDEPAGIRQAVIGDYNQTVNEYTPLPKPNAKAFSKANQFTLCSEETLAYIQILETQSQLRQIASGFTSAQKTKLIDIIKKDMANDADFAPAFAKFVPSCASVVKHNTALTQESYSVTIQIYS